MRILQLGKYYPIRGGVEKVMEDLTQGLSGRGIPCDMLCASFGKASRMQEIRLNADGRIIVVPSWSAASGTMIAPKMVSWLRRHAREYDIIHIHHPDPMACLALRLSGYKGRVILHWHSDILKRKAVMALYRPLQSWLVRRADTIVGTTPVYVEQSPCLQGVQNKVTYVPIGIEPVTFDPEAAAAVRNRFPGKKLIFSLGRLVPYKGYSHLVDAAKFLGPEYLLLIGGTGPLQGQLHQQIEAEGLEDRVLLLGRIDDAELPAFYGACDVFVMSSVMKTEAFGIVLIEAMSCGKPVVATRIPESGVAWVNEDGVSGLNVEPRNSEELAIAIRRICESGDAARFSEGARNRFNQTFTYTQMIDKIIDIYEN